MKHSVNRKVAFESKKYCIISSVWLYQPATVF